MMANEKRPGRRPLADTPATTHLHVRVTPGQRLEIRRVAAAHGTDVSGILREAVNEFVGDFQERRVFRPTK